MDFLNSLTSGLGNLVQTGTGAWQAFTGSVPTTGNDGSNGYTPEPAPSWMTWLPLTIAALAIGGILFLTLRRNK